MQQERKGSLRVVQRACGPGLLESAPQCPAPAVNGRYALLSPSRWFYSRAPGRRHPERAFLGTLMVGGVAGDFQQVLPARPHRISLTSGEPWPGPLNKVELSDSLWGLYLSPGVGAEASSCCPRVLSNPPYFPPTT